MQSLQRPIHSHSSWEHALASAEAILCHEGHPCNLDQPCTQPCVLQQMHGWCGGIIWTLRRVHSALVLTPAVQPGSAAMSCLPAQAGMVCT